ncbi:hypothetical protein HK405_002110, partial [Cladochytrium tenue]
LLLERGATPDHPGPDGSRPIHLAADGGHLSIVQLLLERGAEVARQDVFGRSPVHSVVDGNYIFVLDPRVKSAHLAVLQLLLDAAGSSSTDVADCFGKRPIHIAADHGDLRSARLLLARGASLAEHKGDCNSPLYLAARMGKTSLVRLLLDHGAKLARKDTRSKRVRDEIKKARNVPGSE